MNAVLDHLGKYPAPIAQKLGALRALILGVAERTEGVGPIEEALRWNQPSFLTSGSGSGSTVRIDARGEEGDVAVYFHCQTDLVENFRRLYPESFGFEGNRALILAAGMDIPERELSHCVSLALTYHSRRKARRGRPRKPKPD